MRMPRPRPLRSDPAAAVGPPGSRHLALSVVIVANGDTPQLARCLDALAGSERRGLDLDLIIVDRDPPADMTALAQDRGAQLIRLDGTRGARAAAGAKAATAEWLMLLRAETVLDRGWDATVMVFAAEDRNRERGGVFPLAVIGDSAATWRVRFRNRFMALPSGAQGLVLRRRFLVHLGGVADLERGEDLVLGHALGLARMVVFDVNAKVEARDWPTGGRAAWLGALRIFLFRIKVPARWLQRLGD